MTDDEVTNTLSGLVSPKGVTFLADGVIYHNDRTRNVRQLVDTLKRQHTAYEHMVYRPVVSAVNEDQGVVFTAVYYVLRNRAPLFGAKEPTERISKGFLLEKMSFNKETGLLESSLVTRQMTLEERDALLLDPNVWQPAVVDEAELVAVPDIVAGLNDYKYIGEIISKWDSMWSSEAKLDELPKVLAPDCRAHDGYGLANKPDGILWQGLDEARTVIRGTHSKYENRNQLVSYAVSYEHKLGFHHWRADAINREDKQRQPIQGLGLICFNKHLQIRDIYDFCMKPYPLRQYTNAA